MLELVLAAALQYQTILIDAVSVTWGDTDRVAWMAGIAHAESTWDKAARSKTGVKGLMQLSGVARREIARLDPRLIDIDPYDPVESIKGAAVLLKFYESQHYRQGACEKRRRTTAAYHCGPGCVRSAVSRGGSDWLSRIKKETRGYVPRVLSLTASYLKNNWPGVRVC